MFTPLRATATISQHVPPLCAILADVVSTPSERRQHPDAERARRVQSIVSSPLIVGQDQTQAHSSCTVRGASRQLLGPDDGSHIHRIVRPRCRTESSWRRSRRVWACTRPLQSVHAAAELVCRGRVVVLVSLVISTAPVGRVTLPPYK